MPVGRRNARAKCRRPPRRGRQRVSFASAAKDCFLLQTALRLCTRKGTARSLFASSDLAVTRRNFEQKNICKLKSHRAAPRPGRNLLSGCLGTLYFHKHGMDGRKDAFEAPASGSFLLLDSRLAHTADAPWERTNSLSLPRRNETPFKDDSEKRLSLCCVKSAPLSREVSAASPQRVASGLASTQSNSLSFAAARSGGAAKRP